MLAVPIKSTPKPALKDKDKEAEGRSTRLSIMAKLVGFLVLISYVVIGVSYGQSLNVADFGAVGNGTADDSLAFSKAWTALRAAGNPTLEIPSNKTFLSKQVSFSGPCKLENPHIKTPKECAPAIELVQMARTMVLQSRNWAKASVTLHGLDHSTLNHHGMSLSDCVRLYNDSESMLSRLLSRQGYTIDDARTWLSGVMANHRTCLEGLDEKGFGVQGHAAAQNLTTLLSEALAMYGKDAAAEQEPPPRPKLNQGGRLLASWNPSTSKADFIVAKDGSGTYKTINEAMAAVARMGSRRPQRVIVYVKAGVYNEKVDIDTNLKNIMLVGDGMDRTIVTGSRNLPDGATLNGSATFCVSGDGFWARDMTFENTAGPNKYQAVALSVSSDRSVFYRCSFRGYQDTLYVHSRRQFYRDCHIYGTIDFIFGDAAVVFQNCDIFVKRPMNHQDNVITAQGRENPSENTGISIQGSRVRPASDFDAVKHLFKSYLGRPWKKYSRTVFLKTDLDGLIDRNGWSEWSGNFALSTLYYAEYMNTGIGAATQHRVNWPGFHVFNSAQQALPFTVSRLIQGESWIPETGVPFWSQI